MLVAVTVKGARNQGLAPSGQALGFADFVNGDYSWGATSLTAADVVDQTGWITVNGLEIPASQSAAAHLLNDFGDAILSCQWTVLAEVELVNLSGGSPTTSTIVSASAADAFYFIQLSIDGSFGEWDLFDGDNSFSRDAFDDAHGISLGVHKIAATRIDSKCSISVDGNAVATDTSSTIVLPNGGNPMINAYLGGYASPTGTGRAITIRKFSIFSPVADSALPSLSA